MAVKTLATERHPQPTPPVRQFSFTDFQVNNPVAPPPGDRLDGEVDRTNLALAATARWAGVSLNTDGTLRHATVGKNQLEPGLFDHIEADATQTITPLVEDTRAAAKSALHAADAADASALAAATQRDRAEQAAQRAEIGTHGTAEDAASAAASAVAAAASANAAADSANHALGDANLAEDWAQVSIEWAEHMPDTIPPDILATNAMTGEHWSSRWWAHRAHEIVLEDTQEVLCQIESYWMGAHSVPPTQNSCGDPLVTGAMYFNTTSYRTQVWDGVEWADIVQTAAGVTDRFLYLPTAPISVFSGPDSAGHVFAADVVSSIVEVYLNGVKLLDGTDYTWTASAVTLMGPVGSPNTVEIVGFNEAIAIVGPPSGVKVNTNLWVFDGTTRTGFPLKDSLGNTISPPGAVDCLVSLNGVIQEAGGDFTVRPGFIDFTVAPEADADKWMVVGLPLGAGATTLDAALERIKTLEARIAALEAA